MTAEVSDQDNDISTIYHTLCGVHTAVVSPPHIVQQGGSPEASHQVELFAQHDDTMTLSSSPRSILTEQ